MLGPLPLIAMGQQENQPRFLFPFGTSRGNKLVNDDLSGICKVAKLGFPHYQRIWRVNAIAILETKGTSLAQRAIVDRKGCMRFRNVPQRNIGFVVCIEQYGVTMAKGSTFNVLTGQANRCAIGENGGKGERLRLPPIDTTFWTKR